VLQTLPQLIETYVDSGLVRYVFKDFPLPSHANAQMAAEGARCAGVQDAYWEMHHRLFQSQAEWSRQSQEGFLTTLTSYAQDLGLDEVAFGLCLESGQFDAQVREDVWEGQQAGVRGTPSFLINGQHLVGAYPFEDFQRLIEAELAKQR
jgi:protein-disulfide isomerase